MATKISKIGHGTMYQMEQVMMGEVKRFVRCTRDIITGRQGESIESI